MLHRDIMQSLLAGMPRSGDMVRAKKKNDLRVVLALLPENTPGNGSHLKLSEIVAKMGLEHCHLRAKRVANVLVPA